MARDEAYYGAEEKIKTMIEGFEGYIDWSRTNQDNLSIKKIIVNINKGGEHVA
jgi:hypothetical protein